jgi:putative iron-dependent peroxidase
MRDVQTGTLAPLPAFLGGGSLVAVRQWLHDLGQFDAMSPCEQDQTIGRRRSDHVELDDAPVGCPRWRNGRLDLRALGLEARRS